LRLAGASPASAQRPLDGRDLWPALIGDSTPIHDEILINSAPGVGALRRGDWKLVLNGHRHFKDGAPGPKFSWTDLLKKDGVKDTDALREQVELFNLRDDPGETRNLASTHSDKVRELTARYERYAREAVPLLGGDEDPHFKPPQVWGEWPARNSP
jgi:hypothetical protein